MTALNALVTEAVDIVVHSERVDGVPVVTEVLAVEDQQTGEGATAFTVTELFARPAPDEPLAWTGNLPVRCARALSSAGFDVRELLDTAVIGGLGAGAMAGAGAEPGQVGR
jgi:pilus assembly protein CpaF